MARFINFSGSSLPSKSMTSVQNKAEGKSQIMQDFGGSCRESNLKRGMSSHWGQTRVLICQVGGTGKVPPPPIVLDLLYAPQFFTFCCQMWSDKRRGWAQEGKKMFGAVNCKLSQIWVEKFPPLNRNYIMLTFVRRALGLTNKQLEFNLLASIHRKEWWKQVGNHFALQNLLWE